MYLHDRPFVVKSLFLFRLKYICKSEGFKTSAIALSALAEYTGMFLLHIFICNNSETYVWSIIV